MPAWYEFACLEALLLGLEVGAQPFRARRGAKTREELGLLEWPQLVAGESQTGPLPT